MLQLLANSYEIPENIDVVFHLDRDYEKLPILERRKTLKPDSAQRNNRLFIKCFDF